MTGVWSCIVFVFTSLYLRGVWRGEQGDKKRQSNQLGFQGLCSAFPVLIRYSSNSPLPKNTQEGHPNEDWGAAVSAHHGAGGSPYLFLQQLSSIPQKDAQVPPSHVPQCWWSGCFWRQSKPGPNPLTLTAVTFMGTCPMTLQVESCCRTGISRQTDISSGNGVEIRGNVWRRGESSLETQ